jgi:transposase InsO family protein
MKIFQGQYSLHELCAALGVTRSGYQTWAQRVPGVRAQADAQLLPLLREGHAEGRGNYGRPRLLAWLAQRGIRCGHTRAWRLLRHAGLGQKRRRKFRPLSLTDSNHDLPVAPNRLLHQQQPARPNAVWQADITYVATDEGWLYVAGILDRCTRRCVGRAMGDSLHTALPLAAWQMALTQQRPPPGLVHHSDRGVQYASELYRQNLHAAGVVSSMSRRGNCYDNAAIESFWSALKRELVYRRHFATRAEARAAIFEWIEVFYNRVRLHSALGFKSPVDFETQLN